MIKTIIITKTVIASIIWRVDVNQFHLPGKLSFQSMQSQEIVTFNDEIICYCVFRQPTFLIDFSITNKTIQWVFTLRIISFSTCQYLRL